MTRRSTSRSTASTIASPLYAMPPNLTRPLRVVLVTPGHIPVWLSRFLQLAADTSWLAVSILPVSGASLPKAAPPAPDVRMFLAFDRARRRGANAMLRPVPLRARDCLTLATPVAGDAATAELKERVRELQPSLVLSLGPRSWSQALADCASLGCWDIDAGLVDADWAGVSLLRPLVEGSTSTEFAVELDGAPLAPWGQARTIGATRHGSFGAQRDTVFRRLPLLLMRMMHRLAADEFVPPNRTALLRQATARPLPVGASAVAFASTMSTAVQWQFQKGRKVVPWHLVLCGSKQSIDPSAPRVVPDAIVQSREANYWADPCAVETDGRQLIFVEEMWPDHKGVIACVELIDGTAKRLGIALEESAHVSYPQVFESDGQWYMTVESSQLRRVSLYRATDFPLGWERVCDLVTGRVCADPTLHFQDGHWYLFATVSEDGNGTWDELFVFVSKSLTGPYRPHPANPVVSDVRRARPGGRLFRRDGKLIRPAQDCAANYGSALVFNEVLSLSPTHYEERPLSRLSPDWAAKLVACHTYSASETLEVIDARGYPDPGTPSLEPIEPPAALRISGNPVAEAMAGSASAVPVPVAPVSRAPSATPGRDSPQQ
ncbi:hypothetical protein ACFFGH_14860 [Lysobacter korlensis]|uniref:Glucosamine inositolphosphorylceramide transferase 1 N-terminal domain-containing protein n=1 Tax=Lysobacter korlensis TaxID=553636 RepID=A0ABV6RRC9_9GAMM